MLKSSYKYALGEIAVKRYLFASVLSFGLLITTGQIALAQDDSEDESVEDADEEVVEEEETEAEDEKGTRHNPFLVGETGEIAMRTHYYQSPFSRTTGNASEMIDEDLAMMEEAMDMRQGMMYSTDDERAFMDMYWPPYFNGRTHDGIAGLTFNEVLRGDDALDFMQARDFYDNRELPEGYEWAVFDFTFEWLESEDPNSIYVSEYEFSVFDQTGASVNMHDFYAYYNGMFNSSELYVGAVVNSTFARVVPSDEPFMIRFGDNYMWEHTFFEFNGE